MTTRNSSVLADFTAYCTTHPDERFWQAPRNWANVNFIFVARQRPMDEDIDNEAELYDTFYREGKDA